MFFRMNRWNQTAKRLLIIARYLTYFWMAVLLRDEVGQQLRFSFWMLGIICFEAINYCLVDLLREEYDARLQRAIDNLGGPVVIERIRPE